MAAGPLLRDRIEIDFRGRGRSVEVEGLERGRMKLAEFGEDVLGPEAEPRRTAGMINARSAAEDLEIVDRRAGGGENGED